MSVVVGAFLNGKSLRLSALIIPFFFLRQHIFQFETPVRVQMTSSGFRLESVTASCVDDPLIGYDIYQYPPAIMLGKPFFLGYVQMHHNIASQTRAVASVAVS